MSNERALNVTDAMRLLAKDAEITRLRAALADAQAVGFAAGVEAAKTAVSLNAWKHGGDDAYSVGMDVGARQQNEQDLAAIRALTPPDATAAAVDIVPDHCTSTALAFDPGVLCVNRDGSGYIAIDEDDFVLEDDRDGEGGSVHWIVRLDASEVIALRDFLNRGTVRAIAGDTP